MRIMVLSLSFSNAGFISSAVLLAWSSREIFTYLFDGRPAHVSAGFHRASLTALTGSQKLFLSMF